MPATAAAALLDWQPVLVLEKENYALREENRHLHFQVRELLSWKERALKQLMALGPKRQRANRDVEHATQLQRKLQTVEQSLLERSALDEANQQLQQTQRRLEQHVAQLEEQAATRQEALDRAVDGEERARAHVQQIADQFREHLEQLVAIRERIDSAATHGVVEGDGLVGAIPEEEEQVGDDPANNEHTHNDGHQQCEDEVDDPAVLVTGLAAVSDKCLRWFEQHVAQTFAQLQDKAARYEAQHAELEQLRARVLAVRHDVDLSVAKEKQQAQQLVKTQSENAQLELQLRALRASQTHAARGHAAMGDHVRLLVTEVRQYLRLVRGEIKKKFGYVPEAITHADNWARILDALDALERQLRIAHA